jgi:hypothetical protein
MERNDISKETKIKESLMLDMMKEYFLVMLLKVKPTGATIRD